MTGIFFDTVTGEFAVTVEAAGGVVGYAATPADAAALLCEELARWARYHRAQADSLAAMMPVAVPLQAATACENAAPVIVAAPVANVAQAAIARPRCPFHRCIRRAFAIAKEAGLDTRNDEGFRRAVGDYFGRAIESREQLTARDWLAVGDAVKARRLAW